LNRLIHCLKSLLALLNTIRRFYVTNTHTHTRTQAMAIRSILHWGASHWTHLVMAFVTRSIQQQQQHHHHDGACEVLRHTLFSPALPPEFSSRCRILILSSALLIRNRVSSTLPLLSIVQQMPIQPNPIESNRINQMMSRALE